MSGTGREISNIVFAFFDELAVEHGIDPRELVAGLPVTLDELRDRRGRFSWDVLAEVSQRFADRVGMAPLRSIGHQFMRTNIAEPLRRVGGMVVSAPFLYRVVTRWLAPDYYRHAEFTLEESGQGKLVQTVRIKPGLRDAPEAWFLLLCGGMEALPTMLGQPFARIDVDSGPREARFTITLPARNWAERLRGATLAFASARALDRLAEQQAEMRVFEEGRARAEDAARQSEQRARAILDRIDEIVVIVGATDARLAYANPAAIRLLGLDVTAIERAELRSLIHPDDGPRIAEVFAPLVARRAQAVETELRFRDARGQWRDFEISATNLIDDPALGGILLISRDVTPRRAAERALHERERAHAALLASLPGMAYRARPDGTLELASAGGAALTGWSPADLVDGTRSLRALMVEDDRERVAHTIARAVAAHTPFSVEYRLTPHSSAGAPTARPRWVLDIGAGVHDATGALVAVEGFISDVTERKALEEQLSHSQRLDGIGRLAGGIAHDFNNLLGAMLSYAELAIAELPSTSTAAQDVGEIKSAVQRASDLTRQLLAFARKQVIQPKVVEVNELLLSLDRLLRRVLGADIALSTLPASGLWRVEVDPSQLEQVLLNLAINAREAMPRGGTLTLETRNVALDTRYADSHIEVPPGDYVMIAVSDTGVGMAPDVQSRVFEPFFTTKGAAGTGLGLATCYGIVRQAGGHIFVYSEVGRGTTFKIYLPRTTRTVEPSAPRREVPLELPRGGERVLVVEDHPQLRAVMDRALRGAGYHVEVAANGVDAIALVQAAAVPFHLLVTDVVMPGMSGHELVDELKKTQPTLKVLYVSGYTENSVIHHGVPDTGVAFLPKPFSPQQFAARVRDVLDTRL